MPPTPPASPFATLLRRSKFASFDPQIGQVYTTFGGDLHRGNWGLKRPLPLRRRNAHITVASVDSKEQQTEWSSADSQSRWIRMWDEVAVSPTISEGSPWEMKMGPLAEILWVADSEFGDRKDLFYAKLEEVARQRAEEEAKAKKGGEEVLEVVQDADPLATEAAALGIRAPNLATHNIMAMSPKQFEAYLRNLRRLRPTFKRFVEVKSAVETPKAPRRSLWEGSQRPTEDHKRFLSAQMHVKYEAPDAHVLEQQPHNSGGLTYARAPILQTFLLNKPRPGRIIRKKEEQYTTSSRGSYGYAVSFAGQNTTLRRSLMARDQEPIEWNELATYGTRDPTQGNGKFKIMRTSIVDAPSVVGPRPSGVTNSVVLSEIRSWEDQDETRPNPHWPGSREYVGQNEAVVVADTGVLRAPPKRAPSKPPAPKIPAAEVMATLVGLLAKGKEAAKKKAGGSHVP